MYVPSAFAENDPARIHGFMRSHSFAILTSEHEGQLMASHLPLLLDPGRGPMGELFGHMARANPHWRQAHGEVLAVFSGPHVYVSPTWYEAEGTVPTWNYTAVHAYGTFALVENRDELLAILAASVQAYEGGRTTPWVFDPSAKHVDLMLKGIVGFRIAITRLEGKWKLSQNQPADRRERVVEALAQQHDENSQAIMRLMIAAGSGQRARS